MIRKFVLYMSRILMEQKWHDCRHWGYNGKCLKHENERHIAIALWLDSWLVSPSDVTEISGRLQIIASLN